MDTSNYMDRLVRKLDKRIAGLETENQRLREALGEVYDLWIEDADPRELPEVHNQVRAALENS